MFADVVYTLTHMFLFSNNNNIKMGTNSISMSERCNVLADICRHAGTRSLSSDILSQQVYNAVTFLEQLVSISREICHLKFSKTTGTYSFI